ncbi:hypothetical protein Q0M94_01995 [Deinococcus radiomollis]|uniref:hypothetical protein n=1 Tax=Deinococcus radiomollis TaxID=468916 RepID=UPI003892ADE9
MNQRESERATSQSRGAASGSGADPSPGQPSERPSGHSSGSYRADSSWTEGSRAETYWAELVELYEYKVGDLLTGKSPRGGKRSLGDLRDLLVSAPLEGVLLRRFGQTDRIWKAHLRTRSGGPGQEAGPAAVGQTAPETAAPGFALPGPAGPGMAAALPPAPSVWSLPGDLRPGLTPGLSVNSVSNEQSAVEGLRFTVWREGVRAYARTQTQFWLREPDLVTLRSAYALSVNLERGETTMSVPRSSDPLASLGTPSVAERVVTGLADQVCAAFVEPPAHDPGARQHALIRLREAVTELSLNPFPRHPDQDVMEARVEAAEREQLAPDETRTLIEGIRAEIGPPRSASERLSIRAAAERLTAFIEGIIPVSENGHGPELPVLNKVLYASVPRFQLPAPDDGGTTLTIRLSGGNQAHWRGLSLRWKRAGEGWLVAIGTLEYRLTSRATTHRPDPDAAPIAVMLGDVNGQALLHGDYLYLSARQNDKGLLELLALSRAVALLLDPSGAYLNLRLARAAAQRFRDGRIDAQSVSVLSAERYSAASPEALLIFARKGVEGLLTRMRQRPPQDSEYVFRAATEAVGAAEGHERHLLAALRRVLNPGSRPEAHPDSTPRHVTELGHMRVSGPGELVMMEFAGEPLTIEVVGRVVTLRLDYKGDLAVILPGAPAAILRELLVIDVAAGGILLVRQGGRIVVSYEPHVQG